MNQTADPAARRRLRCYVASPLGFSDATRGYYTTEFLPRLAEIVETVDPWSLTPISEIEATESNSDWSALAGRIATRNIQAIRHSDMLVAQLDGQEVDSGTASEIGFAAGIGLPCFGLRTDLRQSGERGASVNLQVEGFLAESGGTMATSLDELVVELEKWAFLRASAEGNR